MRPKINILKIFLTVLLSFLVLQSNSVQATSVFDVCSNNQEISQTNVCRTIKTKGSSNAGTSLIQSITSIFSYIAGIAAVILIILAGFQFVTSGGDSKKVQQARDTILYAVIGIVIVLIARVILIFVSNKVG